MEYTEVRCDLSKAPSWATHYVHSPYSDAWWFVNNITKCWTHYNHYTKIFSQEYKEGEIDKEDGYYWLELNVTLENE